MADLKDVFSCSYCYCILKTPVILPCSDSVCENHVADLINKNLNAIKCKSCNIEHTIPINGFIKDKRTAKLIELEFHQMDFGAIHSKALNSCKKLD